jgi:peroxiredoxin
MKHLLLPGLLALLCGCGQSGPAPSINLGQTAPSFQAPRLHGSSVNYPAGFAGKATVIRFWADWCHYCEGEMKAIEPIYQRYHSQGVEVLAINAGQDAATVAAFAGKIGASYPLLVDESAGIAKQYGVMGLPTTYFVDGRGVVRAKIVGEADAATFEKNLKIAMGAQP